MSLVRFSACSLAALALFSAPIAHAAGEAKACVDAATQAQAARKQSHLEEARTKLLICTQPKCPKQVLRDCTKWLEEVDAATPTLVFRAKSDRTGDLVDVKVAVDGREVTTNLDGKPIVVEPGVHMVRMEAADHMPEESKIVVSEGEKARSIVITLHSTKPADASAEGGAVGGGGGHTALPWVVAGVGAAAAGTGAVLYFTRPAFPSVCDASKHTCAVGAGDPILAQAKKHDDYGRVGSILMIGGGALLVGGLVWHFVEPSGSEPSKPAEASIRFAPVFGPGTAGASAYGTF